MRQEYVETWRYPLAHGMAAEVRFIGTPDQRPTGAQVKHLIEYMQISADAIKGRQEPGCVAVDDADEG